MLSAVSKRRAVPMPEYNAADRTQATHEECEAAIGRRATLSLTGTITEMGSSEAGHWVKFVVDERWGFGELGLIMDLEAFEDDA